MINSTTIMCTNINQCAALMNKQIIEMKIPGNLAVLSESFIVDIISTNLYVYENMNNLFMELIHSWAPFFIPCTFILCLIFAYVVRNYLTSLVALLSVEAVAMSALFIAPITVPWKSTRFYLGLLFFASFLTIHSNIFDKIQKQSKSNTSNTNNEPEALVTSTSKEESDDNTWLSIYLETALFIRKQHSLSHAEPRISWKRLVYCAVVGFLVDMSTFLIKEFIPVSIQPTNQYFFTSLIGGLWVLLAMDFTYCIANIVCDLIGKPIPHIYRHRHPFLSASISEFWGIRWNPIVGKLLQDSFYKPARRRGISRPLCMIICFAGSAALHAYPQYLSTYSTTDALMMGSFFVVQGCLILIEHALYRLIGMSKYFDEHIMIKAGGPFTGAHFQWLVELVTVTAIVSTCYFTIDRNLSVMSSAELIVCALLPFLAISGYALLTVHSIVLADSHIHNNRVFLQVVISKIVGWILTLALVVALLPLFCIPVLNAVDTLHPKSYVAGPILRTAMKAWNKTVTEH